MTNKNPFEALKVAIKASSRDWSLDRNNAWIYGIVCGWDKKSLKEIQQRFCWDDETVSSLKRLHEKFVNAAI